MDGPSIPGALSRHLDLLDLVISCECLLARNRRQARRIGLIAEPTGFAVDKVSSYRFPRT